MTISAKSALAILAGAVVLSACSSTGEGGKGMLRTALNGPASEAEETTPVVQGTCPTVGLRAGTAYYRTYSGEESQENIVHQASITDVTRQCTLSGSDIVVNVAAAGRLITGPKGSAGAVEMPIRVVAMRGDEVLYSELTNYSATMESGSSQFLFNDADVRIPAAQADDVRLFVGFDEGPYDTP